jgi:putative ABC transport system ATP-binding protein
MLKVRNIFYKITKAAILDRINFELDQNHHLLILGKSGCGKTSLLNILTGLITPNSGEIIFDKTNFSSLSKPQIDEFRAKNIGLIFQNFHLIKEFSLKQNLQIIENISNQKIDEEYFYYLLQKLEMLDFLDHKIHQLSIGQRQRAAIIRAVLNKPKWLFCDEPTSALDDENCQNFIELILDEAAKNKTSIIITTHDQRVKNHLKNCQILNL